MAESLRNPEADQVIPGEYRLTNLDNIISNFQVMYVGEGKIFPKLPSYEIAAVAQRALQEFSFDIIHSEKSIEVEMNDANTFKLPSDFINIVKLTKTDNAGIEREIIQSVTSRATRAAIQDNEYDYVYDQDGDIIFADQSETIKKFQDPGDSGNNAIDRYTGYLDDDDYSYYYQTYLGRRYGLDPQGFNSLPKYVVDYETGILYFDTQIRQDDLVTLRYITDGIGDSDDLTKCYVPKLAEDALYARIMYDLAKVRPATLNVAPLYKKEAMAKTRNAKIRLSNFKQNLHTQIFRGKSKWIKH